MGKYILYMLSEKKVERVANYHVVEKGNYLPLAVVSFLKRSV